MRSRPLLILALVGCASQQTVVTSNEQGRGVAVVRPTGDFEVSGDGSNDAWKRAEWHALRRRQDDGHPYEARFKVLYSTTGMYVLMDGTDAKLTTTGRKDFENLWEEDVYEAFIGPDRA